MPAESRAQKNFMWAVKGVQEGTGKGSGKVQAAAKSMKPSSVEHFIHTKSKGLPEKKAYAEGFMAMCLERGVDPEVLLKQAGIGNALRGLGRDWAAHPLASLLGAGVGAGSGVAISKALWPESKFDQIKAKLLKLLGR